MTQSELAERTCVTEQTIRKIEHGEGNPQLDVLYALVTVLKIDPTEFFYPQESEDYDSRKCLEILLADCSSSQIEALIPIIKGALEAIRGNSFCAVK